MPAFRVMGSFTSVFFMFSGLKMARQSDDWKRRRIGSHVRRAASFIVILLQCSGKTSFLNNYVQHGPSNCALYCVKFFFPEI